MLLREIFESIQGEGPDCGRPAVFVRLHGCNLNCAWCDTDHTSACVELSAQQVVDWIGLLASPNRFVVLTGGEPLMQPIGDLLRLLYKNAYTVQIETNGTLWQPVLGECDQRILNGQWVSIVCSPKPRVPMLEQLRWCPLVKATKLVWGVDTVIADFSGYLPGIIFLQPRDDGDPEKNKANLERCLEVCREEGVRLSVQLHKLIGVQ